MGATPSEVGAVAEREVAYALARAGYDVYVPLFMPHSRVDLVAHRNGQVLRIQVKSARVRADIVRFHTCSNTGARSRSYQGDVDAFGVFAPELETCYLVPIAEVPDRGCHLRVAPARNNQATGVRWAADYEIRPTPGS